eukprot:1058279-Prorocentrum_minimum.AAC.1
MSGTAEGAACKALLSVSQTWRTYARLLFTHDQNSLRTFEFIVFRGCAEHQAWLGGVHLRHIVAMRTQTEPMKGIHGQGACRKGLILLPYCLPYYPRIYGWIPAT